MIYYSEPCITIYWDEALKAVWMEWKGYAEGHAFRAACDAALGLAHKKRATRWVTDLRLAGPVRQDDQKWLNDDWLPRVNTLGQRHVAVIVPQASVARLSMRQIFTRASDAPAPTEYFDNLADARAWLQKT